MAQVLVRVRAAALNPYDMHCLHGTPCFLRFGAGLRRPRFTGIGVDFSGVVENAGKNVVGIKPLDRVIAAMVYSKFVGQEMGLMVARASNEDLALLAELMQQGKVTPVIDRTYRLSEAARIFLRG